MYQYLLIVYTLTKLSKFRPVLLHNCLLVHLAHGIAFDGVDDLQNSRNLVRCHFLLQLRAQRLQFQWLSLFQLVMI